MEQNRTGSWRVVRPIAYKARDDRDGVPAGAHHDRGLPPTPSLLVGAANALLSLVAAESSAAFVYHAGYWSHYDNTAEASSWPLPQFASCAELGQFAADHAILVEGPPREGDVFLLQSPALKAFSRTGIVVGLLRNEIEGGEWHRYGDGRGYYRCRVIEGASSGNGMRGQSAVEMIRNFCPGDGDRFVRWTRLDARERQRGALPPRGQADGAVKETLERERSLVRQAALSLSRHNRAMAEDIEQEGKIAVWELDPTRLDLTRPHDLAYLRRTMLNRMVDAARKLFRGAGSRSRSKDLTPDVEQS